MKRQPKAAERADKVRRLRILVELYEQGRIDLRFADECGFHLTPSVPYGWQPIGQQVGIPTERTGVTNVFGLMNAHNHLRVYPSDKNIDSRFIASCLDDFAGQQQQRQVLTVVVWDNAPWHTAELIRQKQAEWEEQGLFLFYLPKASPHLNKIETLWRFIKYQWLQRQDFFSLKKMQKALHHIFSNFGSHFKIQFSMNY